MRIGLAVLGLLVMGALAACGSVKAANVTVDASPHHTAAWSAIPAAICMPPHDVKRVCP